MRLHLLLAAVGLLPITNARADVTPARGLDGTWEVVSMVVRGEPAPKLSLIGMAVVIKGDKITFKNTQKEGNPETFTVDTSQKPARMTMVEEKDGKKVVTRALYELSGDTLTMAQTPDAKDFPAALESPKGSEVVLVTLKRKE